VVGVQLFKFVFFLTLDYIERTSGCFRLFTRVVTFDVTKTKKQSAQCQVLFNFFQKLKEESNKFHFTKKLTKPDFDIPFITPIVGLGNTFLPKTRFFFGLQTTACLQNSKRHCFPHHTAKNLLTIRFMQSCEQSSIGSILLVSF